MVYMRLTNVGLDISTEFYTKIKEQLDEQKRLLSLPDRITVRDYILSVLLPLGFEEAEKRINQVKAPHIIVP